MKAIIVDDEVAARKVLRERCATEQDIEVVGEYADAESALAALPQQAPDLIFLDVKMGKISGMRLAQSLEPGSAPLVVFVTAFDRYALQAFDVNAADYLLKPFDRHRFRTMLQRVRERYAARNSANYQIAAATLAELQRLAQSRVEARPRLLAETGGALHMVDVTQIELEPSGGGLGRPLFLVGEREHRLYPLDPYQIDFIQSAGNYVTYHLAGVEYIARESIKRLDPLLAPAGFVRIERSLLLNIRAIAYAEPAGDGSFVFTLTTGVRLHSGHTYRDTILDALPLPRRAPTSR